MTTDISAKVYASEAAAIGSGRDNIVELGYGSIESSQGDAAGVAFGVQGEAFDRMAMSVAQDPENYRGVASPILGAESTSAHEFAAHLLSGTFELGFGRLQLDPSLSTSPAPIMALEKTTRLA